MIINTSRDGADSRVESSRTRVSTMDARRLSSFKETSSSASASATRLRARDRDGASKHAFTAFANRVRTRAITAHPENAVEGRGRFVQPRRRCETTATRGERATTTRQDRDERLNRARTCDARSDCTFAYRVSRSHARPKTTKTSRLSIRRRRTTGVSVRSRVRRYRPRRREMHARTVATTTTRLGALRTRRDRDFSSSSRISRNENRHPGLSRGRASIRDEDGVSRVLDRSVEVEFARALRSLSYVFVFTRARSSHSSRERERVTSSRRRVVLASNHRRRSGETRGAFRRAAPSLESESIIVRPTAVTDRSSVVCDSSNRNPRGKVRNARISLFESSTLRREPIRNE